MGQFFQHLAQTTPRSQQEPAADCINTVPFFWEAAERSQPLFLNCNSERSQRENVLMAGIPCGRSISCAKRKLCGGSFEPQNPWCTPASMI